MKDFKRKPTLFEKILLISGFFIGFLGFFIINTTFINIGRTLSYEMISAVFLWIILLFLMVIVAATENQKEEALFISKELNDETRLMKSILKEQTNEIKLLRKDLLEINSKDNKKK